MGVAKADVSRPQRECAMTVTPAISPAAERMRRSRQRRLEGLRSLRIDLRETEIDALVRNGLLKPGSRDDPNAVLRAFYTFLDHTS